MRLQKFIAKTGYCSRRHAEKLIASGHVMVNGKIVTRLGTQIEPETDRITIDNTPLVLEDKLVYILLNKPRGYVTSCDHPGKKIVLDIVNVPQRIYPVGRLDKDSSGLLLLTNDGKLHLQLTHPSFDHEKEYLVTVANPISDHTLNRLKAGIKILGTKTRPARIKRISPSAFKMIIKEGRNRQIRRMVRQVGNRVTDLKRIRMANIRLGRLPEGKWRHLNDIEKRELFQSVQHKIDPLPNR